jgi:sigma-E factor negative regulatory protein RseA
MVKPQNPTPEEALSAWLDDAPPAPAENHHWPASVLNEPDAALKIGTYLAIGKALRGGTDAEVASVAQLDEFWQRVQSGIERAPLERAPFNSPSEAAFEPQVVAANDGQFKWRAVASVAVGALALSAWLAIGPGQSDSESPALASYTPTFVPVMSANVSVVRDPELDAFLAAHRQRGSASALQGPVGFVRNVAWQAGAP